MYGDESNTLFFSLSVEQKVAEAFEAFKTAQALTGMQIRSNPHVSESKFDWVELPLDMQGSILDHTLTSFAVESCYPVQLRFSEVGWRLVPYVARYEFTLMPRKKLLSTSPETKFTISASPEIKFTLTRFLDPVFKQSRLFEESDVSMQEMLENYFNFEETFPMITAVRFEMRSESVGLFQFIQTTKEGTEHVLKTPFWSRVERNTIEQVRERLKTMFYVESTIEY
jgi:hypothetical protein